MAATLPGLVIFGAGGHALAVAEVVTLCSTFELVGFLEDQAGSRTGAPFAGRAILGGREQLAVLREAGVTHALIAVGNCEARLALAQLATQEGFTLATVTHPRAFVSPSARLGRGTVIMPGAVVQAACKIGDNVVINTAASLDHECVLQDGVHVCPGVRLAGRVHVGRACWLGIGSVVVENVCIGAGSIVGAGAVVLDDVPDGVVAYGVPARVVHEVQHRDD